VLAVDTILTMNAFDPTFWMGCAWALIRIIKREEPRWWLAFGVFARLGLENMESMLFLGAALIIGLMLTPQRKLAFNRWLVLGGLAALLLASPKVIWQALHGFPMYGELYNVKQTTRNAPLTWLGSSPRKYSISSPWRCRFGLAGSITYLYRSVVEH
jgi:hypothetical protein